MKAPDYEFKSKVLELDSETDIIKIYSQVSYTLYYYSLFGHQHALLHNKPLPAMSFENAVAFETYFLCRYRKEWLEAGKIFHAHCQRTKRLRGKMHYLLNNYNCSFLTLTFNDDFLQRTSAPTRRQYVSRFLNSLDCPYVGNLDFGKKNGREHYHAVVACVPTDYQMSSYMAGFFKNEIVRDTVDDEVRLAKYVAKLSNHAIKETTKRSALLYSRKHKIPTDVH